jgi:tetratricopeptide (TPR) repeat protein
VEGLLLAQPDADADLLLRAGGKLAENELFAEAAQLFARCRKEHPESFEAAYDLSLAEYGMGRYKEALVSLDSVIVSGKQQALAREYLKGKVWLALGELDRAEHSLAAAFSGDPAQENYAVDLGALYIRRRTYPQAVNTFESALKSNPRSTFLLLGLALSQALGGAYPAVVETCGHLLAIDESFAAARLLLAYAYYMDGQLEKCQQAAATGLAAANPNPYLYYIHAAALLKLDSKEHERMLRELEIARRAIPACSLCYLTASKVHTSAGDNRAAIADLETLVSETDPNFSQAWYRLAALYQQQGETAKADAARARFRAIRNEHVDGDAEMLRSQFLRDGALTGAASH